MKIAKVLTMTAIFLLTACGGEEAKDTKNQQTSATAKRDCNLKMGWEPRAPYQFERNGEISGIDVQIFKQAADKINCNVSFVKNDWATLLHLIEKGEIDVLAGATVTDERQAFAHFSTPYRDESFTLFIRKASTNYDGSTLVGFLSRGKKVGVTRDYYYGQEVYELMNHPQYGNLFENSGSGEESFYNILYSDIDGVLADPVEGHYIIKRKRLGDQIKSSKVHIPSESVAFMFSKKTIKSEQLEQLQAAIKTMVDNEQIQPVIAKF